MLTRCRAHRLVVTFSTLLLVTAFLALASNPADATTISVDPARTFLLTNSDPWTGVGHPSPSLPIALSSLGLFAGDLVFLEQLGHYYNGFAGYDVDTSSLDIFHGMLGLFSSSDEILPSTTLMRVPGAIGAGDPIVTMNTLYGDQPTDVPWDFGIGPATFVTVPLGAQYLFLAAHDSYYSDNSDPNGDLAVRVSVVQPVPEPSTVLLLITGFAVLFGWRGRANSRRGSV